MTLLNTVPLLQLLFYVKKKARQTSIWSLNNNMNHYCLPDLGFIFVKVVYLTQEKAKVLIIYLINP